MFTLLLLLLVPLSLAQANNLWQPGATIQDAASIQVTQKGLDKMGTTLPLVFPSQIAVPDQTSSGSCPPDVTNIWIGVSVNDVQVTPTNGQLNLTLDLNVWINDATDPLHMSGCATSGCDLYVQPFPVTLTTSATAAVVYDSDLGHNVVQVDFGQPTFDEGLEEGAIQSVQGSGFSFCSVSTIATILDASGFSLIDFVWQFAQPVLEAYVDYQVLPDLESQLQDALSAAYFSDTLDFGGVALQVEVQPQDVQITPDGIDVRAEGFTDADQGACMVERDPGGSLRTDTPVPAIGDNPSSTEYAALVSDDIANQGLYSIWRSGLFCFDLSDPGSVSIPFPVNTSLLGLIGGEGFTALFPDSAPLDVFTSPDSPPTVDYTTSHDLVAQAHDLGIDFYADLDGRKARVLGVDLEADIPVDLDFDGTTGKLGVNIGLSSDTVQVVPSMNEIVAGSDQTIEDNFGGILDVVIEQFLGGQLQDLNFYVPSLSTDSGGHVGLSTLTASSAGGGDWLRARAGIGLVAYDNSNAPSSCGSSGGCNSSGGTAPWFFLLPLLWLRRRERRG